MSGSRIIHALTTDRSRATAPSGILLIDNERTVAESIRDSLQREGFRITLARDGTAGIELFRTDPPALVLLDLSLPGLSGLDVCRVIRAESTVPIIILSARDSEADKVAGLEVGADDYIVKPFSTRELVSRVRAHIRRADMFPTPAATGILTGGPVELDLDRHEVRVRGRDIDLTRKEFELLQEFLLRKGRLRTRNYLMAQVWGPDYFGDTKTLDVHVKRLRNKIERDPHNPEYLVTVRGLGYRFLDEPSRSPAWAEIHGSETA